ncbi:AI-2E family transporter [Kordiimonas sediminis]|uniref:AI-2E family transporter n=1 Tax=Kordiimonas sediminis TaxID=1735581 RepID=A0A919AKB7_9PROT|nr:AI-2E family transporter [Kordiimonas sediminis]GHF12332.1 AI-2E family transporter [Kordiimonas sediminis]
MNLIKDWYQRTFSDPQMVLLLLALIVVFLILTFFGRMLTPALAAVVIAFLLDGPSNWLQRKGVPELAAVILVFIVFLVASVLTALAVIPPLIKQITQFVNDAPAIASRIQTLLLDMQTRIPTLISETQVENWLSGLGNEVANIGPKLLEWSLDGLTGAITLVVYTVLVPVMVFFFMKDKHKLLGWIGGFLPTDRPVLEQVWRETLERAGDYARGKVYEIIIVGSAAFVTYQVLGLQYATLLSVATGFSVLIPYVGAATVTIPVAVVAFFQWGLAAETAIAIVAYLVLQALDGNLLAPLLFSEVVDLHPNAIIIAILIFGGLWGFWGVFFAIPLATVANAVIRAWQERSAAEKETAC